jgi:YegS/Rv2252/BmrU family lipid kinase
MSPSLRRATLIYNPVAGFWDWSAVVHKVAKFWAAQGWAIELTPTEYVGHATELARCAAAAGDPLVFGAGGDGTLNEIANGLVGSDTILAPLPVGTANSFAKELGLPRPNVLYPDYLLEVSQALARGRVQTIDVGQVINPDGTPGRYWLLWASTGIDGFVVQQIEPRPRWFKYLGPAGYVARALTFLPQFQGVHGTVTVDGETVEDEFLMINVSNCRMWLGGELRLNRRAVLDDGVYEIWLFRGRHWPKALTYGLEITREEHITNPEVTVMIGTEVSISTTPSMHYHLDGEPTSSTPLTTVLRPAALRMLAPDTTPAGLFRRPGRTLVL